jgi:hypothetical protein
MSKGKTVATRVVLTKEEFNTLVLGERIFPFSRITDGNVDRFKLKHEDLRTIPNVDLVILTTVA